MNKKGYLGDSRYAKVYEKMELLGIVDVSTKRQSDNGTIVWRLPIKNQWKNGSCIEVASFKTGYVRNQNSGYSNYQLNNKKKIAIEIDRLEYLISYCLKNYYIKYANFVANGDYVQKWEHENMLKVWKDGNENATSYDGWNGPNEVQLIIDGHRYKVI